MVGLEHAEVEEGRWLEFFIIRSLDHKVVLSFRD